MGFIAANHKPHAVCIPYPAQGHVTPMMKLAKLLHSRGFHITFVNTEYNRNRFLRSIGPSALDGAKDFHFAAIPDGLPSSDQDATQDIPTLSDSTTKNCLPHFRSLLDNLNDPSSGVPPVSCVVSDGAMSFTLDAARELGITEVVFWTPSACGFMGYLHYQQLIDRGLFPLKDESQLTNGHLDSPIDWVPGIPNMRLGDFPSFNRTTNPDDIMFNYVNREARRSSLASAIILNTFDELESPVLNAMSSIVPPVYTIGPLSLLSRCVPSSTISSLSSSLWKEDPECIEWLDSKEPHSVVYVNFGSITVMSNEQLVEFAWGLANSEQQFLWVIRPDLVKGESAVVPFEFSTSTRDRGMLVTWCQQEEVLAHRAVGGFLTHNGWNSTLESLCSGVPMLCWPFFAEQQMNCRFACEEWGVGMEISGDLRREKVEGMIRELMRGEKGEVMRRRALGWRESAVRATEPCGSSSLNFENVINDVLKGKINEG